MGYSVFLFLLGALIAVLLTPASVRAAVALGAIDHPDAGRHRHAHPTPRLGGLAIFFAAAVTALLFVPLDGITAAWLSGGALIVALGVSDDLYTLPLLNRLKNLRELLAVLPDRAVVVQAHPFRDNMTVVSPDLLFGVEAHNGRTSPFRNKMARDYAEHYGKVMTSGSDFHKMKDLAKGGIATHRTVTCSAELVELLKSGDYSLIGKQE